ncbi:TadE/TadG family type IV pilus assembly protein [Oricola cellulosilytica]|uniref:Pilus assembly protein n=1 Tax=Oricola cellulosilytica TaxID=1429082 RepID=A0A4V2MP03_9HYPH|nr:hypothetical protein [Oricola cellulosilytica]TCD15467.1 hypothetical protein E0D97_08030 [Oricola cellulosilytica]
MRALFPHISRARALFVSLGISARRLRDDRNGIAAVEFGLLVPVLALAFVLMLDIAQGIAAKYDTERKMRLAIEGIIRYGDDTAKVQAFANNSGNEAFPSSPDAPVNNSTLVVDPYYICRNVDGTFATFAPSESPSCTNYETWYELTTAGTVTGMFGKTFNIGATVHIFSE